jgi:uncharacterized protein (DUF1778 family)
VAQVSAFENPRKKSLGNESIRCLPSFEGQLKRLLEMYGKTPYIDKTVIRGDVMSQKPVRTSRIEARIAPDALKVVKRAAEIQGRSVSDFVVAAAQEVATRTIEDAQIIRLSVEDQRAFAEAVLNPPPPSIGLLKAAEAYRTLIKASR